MPKYIVKCYYTYCGRVEVEANSIEEAAEIGYAQCEEMSSDELDFIGYTDSEVIDDDGEIHQFQ